MKFNKACPRIFKTFMAIKEVSLRICRKFMTPIYNDNVGQTTRIVNLRIYKAKQHEDRW